MVPAGIPGTPTGDFIPPYDPAGARKLLADAGFADGAALGPVTFVSSGGGYDGGIISMLEENLGVQIDYSAMAFNTYQERLATDPPQIWSTNWIADYPGPNDFLGVLLGTGSTANQGGWSSQPFDDAIAEATSAAEPRGRDGGLRPRDGDRPRRRPDGARHLRHVVHARPRGPARRGDDRDRDPAAGRPRVGAMTRARGPIAALVLVAAWLTVAAGAPGPVSAAGVTFGDQKIESVYGTGITFKVPVQVTGPLARLDIQLRFPDSLGPFVETVPFDAAGGATSATYVLDITGDSHLVPNTTIEATWAAYPAIGQPPVLSKAATIRYEDTEHDWQSLKGDVVTVHWYAGDQAFAQHALEIGDKAVKDTADLLGVQDVKPVDFFIYGDTDSFRTALGPGTRENVGGQAHADIRTLFALISPDQINDAGWAS